MILRCRLPYSVRLWECGLITWTEYWGFRDERTIITVMTIFLRISSTDVAFCKHSIGLDISIFWTIY